MLDPVVEKVTPHRILNSNAEFNGRKARRQAAAAERQAAYDALPLDVKAARAAERARDARARIRGDRVGVGASLVTNPTREIRKLGL